jgi:hypothetical protein
LRSFFVVAFLGRRSTIRLRRVGLERPLGIGVVIADELLHR